MSEQTKFTAGPWEFRTYADGCTIVSRHNAPGRSVRDVLKGVKVKVDVEVWDDQRNARETSADARLIVAAPDLYEALTLLLSALERTAANFRHAVNGRPVRDMAETLAEGRRAEEKARAALARAEGKE